MILSSSHCFKNPFVSIAHFGPVLNAPGVTVYLDESLRRFEVVYPAAGTAASAVELNLAELEKASGASGWMDVCKGWRPEE